MHDRNLTEGLEISSALSSGSYRKVKYNCMRILRSGMLIVHNLSLRQISELQVCNKYENVCMSSSIGLYWRHTKDNGRSLNKDGIKATGKQDREIACLRIMIQ